MNANFNTSTLARVLDFPNQAVAQVGARITTSLPEPRRGDAVVYDYLCLKINNYE